MPVVLASNGQGWRAELKVLGNGPRSRPVAGECRPHWRPRCKANAAGATPGAPPSGASLTLWAALLGALLGGLILNLMPCVFPVLAIKVVGFTRHADDQRAHRISGLAYTAGVITSFVALGALLLALRAAGESLGWGFQLQSPGVVAALAALFTLIGLNLAGLFEFGSFLPSGVATLQAKHPVVDSFLTGMLAVAVASPCTAPFMGASLGLAVGLPAGQALAVFAALGLGLALPYLAASFVPAVARALPRPGAWMDTFRRLMAFPMFATVVWLVWVLGQQTGIDGAGALLALLVSGAFVVWALTLQGRARTGICYAIHSRLRPFDAGNRPECREIFRFHPGREHRRALAALGPGQSGSTGRQRPAGVRRFHRRLVRDLPVQQEDHAGRRRRAGRLRRQEGATAARRLDPPRPGHHRRAERPGPQWGAGVRAVPARAPAPRAVGDPERGRGAFGTGRALKQVVWVLV